MTEKVAEMFEEGDSVRLMERLEWFVRNMYTKYLGEVEPTAWGDVDVT